MYRHAVHGYERSSQNVDGLHPSCKPHPALHTGQLLLLLMCAVPTSSRGKGLGVGVGFE